MSCYRTSQSSPQGKGNKPFVVLGIKKEIIEWYEFKVLDDHRMKNDVLNLNNISKKKYEGGVCKIFGNGLKSQKEWNIEGEAMVTDIPITFLGYVNRETGKVEEEGHPLDGETITDKILIFFNIG